MSDTLTKWCSACKSNLVLEIFHRNKANSDGLNDHCKACRKEQGKKWYEENRELQLKRTALSREKAKTRGDSTYGAHRCGECGKGEPEVQFYRRKSGGKYYRHFLCTGCKREYNKKYPQKITEEVKERQKALRKHNRSKKDNAARYMTQNAKFSDRRKGIKSNLTKEYVQILLDEAKGCVYCGDSESKLSLDRIDCSEGHIVGNVAICCVRCNNFRGDMPYAAWIVIAPVMKKLRESGMLDGWKGRLPISAEVKEHPNYRLCTSVAQLVAATPS